jgi:hypothetical protein
MTSGRCGEVSRRRMVNSSCSRATNSPRDRGGGRLLSRPLMVKELLSRLVSRPSRLNSRCLVRTSKLPSRSWKRIEPLSAETSRPWRLTSLREAWMSMFSPRPRPRKRTSSCSNSTSRGRGGTPSPRRKIMSSRSTARISGSGTLGRDCSRRLILMSVSSRSKSRVARRGGASWCDMLDGAWCPMLDAGGGGRLLRTERASSSNPPRWLRGPALENSSSRERTTRGPAVGRL